MSSGSSTETAYTVEARYNFTSPAKIGKQIFDDRWRRVDFEPSQIGVPAAPLLSHRTLEHGMLGYQAAQALRWWLHAAAEAESVMGGLCLESRLMKHTIKTTYEISEGAPCEIICVDGRNGFRPKEDK